MLAIKNTSYPDFDLLQGKLPTSVVDNSFFVFTVYDSDNVQSLTGKYEYLKQHFFFQNLREEFYVTAIDNLIKKNDYLQLTIQFDQDLISDKEFDAELDNNESKYLIKMNPDFRTEYFKVINDIIPRLKRNFSSDEISELFSAPIEIVNSYIQSVDKEGK
jgi:hypothetical protein